MPSQTDKTPPNDPGPYWRDVQPRVTVTWLLPSKTRGIGLLIAAASVIGAFATYAISGGILLAYSKITGDLIPQREMLIVGLCSLPVYAALLVGFCYGLAVFITGRMSTAFQSEESQATKLGKAAK